MVNANKLQKNKTRKFVFSHQNRVFRSKILIFSRNFDQNLDFDFFVNKIGDGTYACAAVVGGTCSIKGTTNAPLCKTDLVCS